MSEAGNRPPEENTKEAIDARLGRYALTPIKDKTEVAQIPTWAKTALMIRVLEGGTNEDIAKKFGKSGGTLSQYANSVAGKKWLEPLLEFVADPVAMAKAWLGANAMSITLKRFIYLEALEDSGQWEAADKVARDLQDRMGIIAKRGDGGGAITLKVNFAGANFDAPVIEADWAEEKSADDE